MQTCQRCGNGVSWTNDSVRLAGGATAHLCNFCITEFDRFLKHHPISDEQSKVLARTQHYASLSLAGQPVSEEAWLALEQWDDDLKKRLHDVTSEWLQNVKQEA